MPRLFTSMSTCGNCAITCCAPRSVPRSAAIPCAEPLASIAARTRSSVRPFTITDAPSFANACAIAKPMPAVEPDTRAVLPLSCRSIALVRCSDSHDGCTYWFGTHWNQHEQRAFLPAALLVNRARDVGEPDHRHVAGSLIQHQRVLVVRRDGYIGRLRAHRCYRHYPARLDIQN